MCLPEKKKQSDIYNKKPWMHQILLEIEKMGVNMAKKIKEMGATNQSWSYLVRALFVHKNPCWETNHVVTVVCFHPLYQSLDESF